VGEELFIIRWVERFRKKGIIPLRKGKFISPEILGRPLELLLRALPYLGTFGGKFWRGMVIIPREGFKGAEN